MAPLEPTFVSHNTSRTYAPDQLRSALQRVGGSAVSFCWRIRVSGLHSHTPLPLSRGYPLPVPFLASLYVPFPRLHPIDQVLGCQVAEVPAGGLEGSMSKLLLDDGYWHTFHHHLERMGVT
jgi:hypothetical protein